MFSRPADTTTATAAAVSSCDHPIPLSHLALDLDVPVEGWASFLGRRGVAIVPDSLRRDCVSHGDALRLLDEQRADQLRRARLQAAQEQQAIADDELRRAGLYKGLPLVDGLSGTEALLAGAVADRPRRRSMVEEALGGETLTYHPMADAS